MKHVNITLIILFALLVLSVFGNISIASLDLFFKADILSVPTANRSVSIITKVIFCSKAIALLVFILAAFTLIKRFKDIIQGHFFSSKLIQSFSNSGLLFLVSGSIGFITSIFELVNTIYYKDLTGYVYLNLDSKGFYIMLLILGLFFIVFASVLKQGAALKAENDLTI